jgi:hypothetical protein
MLRTRTRLSAVTAAAAIVCTAALAAAAPRADLPRLVKRGTTQQLVVKGKPFTILGGELHNSSASNLAYMEPVWPRLKALGLNTVLATVSWELVEPAEGKFDFRLVDGLVRAARRHDLKLVLLWFGSWKNGTSSYVPGWVKRDVDRFPRVERANGQRVEVLTPLAPANRDADARAFAAFMRRLRQIDEREGTVIMVQVENEVGTLGDSRDRSPMAEQAFAGPVPAALMEHLAAHKAELIPELAAHWTAAGAKAAGTWSEVFGDGADETFMAWHMSRYVGHIAAAGKQELPLPMFANAWLAGKKAKPGQYPSGGPISKMMDVWRAGAPAIDFLAPDIYDPDFKGITASYTRSGNPLFIPEAARGPDAAAKVFYALGAHGAIGFCPFGIDSLKPDHPIAASYATIAELLPAIEPHLGSGRTAGLLQTGDKDQRETLELEGYRLEVTYKGKTEDHDLPAAGLVAQVGLDEFLVSGAAMQISFRAKGDGGTGILEIDEGRFRAGRWIPGRRLNGDENIGGVRVILPPGAPSIQRVRLYRFPHRAPAGTASR